tara:strand:- start:592 stop:798 length:207 start_codon:yes stop_codon:yes gene_type:complete
MKTVARPAHDRKPVPPEDVTGLAVLGSLIRSMSLRFDKLASPVITGPNEPTSQPTAEDIPNAKFKNKR